MVNRVYYGEKADILKDTLEHFKEHFFMINPRDLKRRVCYKDISRIIKRYKLHGLTNKPFSIMRGHYAKGQWPNIFTFALVTLYDIVLHRYKNTNRKYQTSHSFKVKRELELIRNFHSIDTQINVRDENIKLGTPLLQIIAHGSFKALDKFINNFGLDIDFSFEDCWGNNLWHALNVSQINALKKFDLLRRNAAWDNDIKKLIHKKNNDISFKYPGGYSPYWEITSAASHNKNKAKLLSKYHTWLIKSNDPNTWENKTNTKIEASKSLHVANKVKLKKLRIKQLKEKAKAEDPSFNVPK